MSKGAIAEQPSGTELFDVSEKVFPDVKAEPGEKAYTFMHTVPYEGSVGLVNLLTTTRVLRKGFETNLVLYGPGVLMASGTRGFPKVGDEAFPALVRRSQEYRAVNEALNEGADPAEPNYGPPVMIADEDGRRAFGEPPVGFVRFTAE